MILSVRLSKPGLFFDKRIGYVINKRAKEPEKIPGLKSKDTTNNKSTIYNRRTRTKLTLLETVKTYYKYGNTFFLKN